MQINKLEEYIETGRELEFNFNGKKYSLTYGHVDSEEIISFCEFDKPSVEVRNIDQLLGINYNGQPFCEIWENLREEDLWIF